MMARTIRPCPAAGSHYPTHDEPSQGETHSACGVVRLSQAPKRHHHASFFPGASAVGGDIEAVDEVVAVRDQVMLPNRDVRRPRQDSDVPPVYIRPVQAVSSGLRQFAAPEPSIQFQSFRDDCQSVRRPEHVLHDDLLLLQGLVVFEETPNLPENVAR